MATGITILLYFDDWLLCAHSTVLRLMVNSEKHSLTQKQATQMLNSQRMLTTPLAQYVVDIIMLTN